MYTSGVIYGRRKSSMEDTNNIYCSVAVQNIWSTSPSVDCVFGRFRGYSGMRQVIEIKEKTNEEVSSKPNTNRFVLMMMLIIVVC